MDRRLNSHKTARMADEIPSVTVIARHIIPAPSSKGSHWFWQERKGTRSHDSGGQATLRWRGRWYNVVRVLLQHRLSAWAIRAVNTCGLPQCVCLDHWRVEPSFLGVVAKAQALATVQVGETWRLSDGGTIVERDVAFVATINPGSHATRHVVRALHEEHETVFLTACNLVVDPALVAAGGEVSCAECVR